MAGHGRAGQGRAGQGSSHLPLGRVGRRPRGRRRGARRRPSGLGLAAPPARVLRARVAGEVEPAASGALRDRHVLLVDGEDVAFLVELAGWPPVGVVTVVLDRQLQRFVLAWVSDPLVRTPVGVSENRLVFEPHVVHHGQVLGMLVVELRQLATVPRHGVACASKHAKSGSCLWGQSLLPSSSSLAPKGQRQAWWRVCSCEVSCSAAVRR